MNFLVLKHLQSIVGFVDTCVRPRPPPDRWYFDYIAGASSVITACITGDRVKVKPQYLNSD